jgi:hypothetical protein
MVETMNPSSSYWAIVVLCAAGAVVDDVVADCFMSGRFAVTWVAPSKAVSSAMENAPPGPAELAVSSRRRYLVVTGSKATAWVPPSPTTTPLVVSAQGADGDESLETWIRKEVANGVPQAIATESTAFRSPRSTRSHCASGNAVSRFESQRVEGSPSVTRLGWP